MPLRLSPSQTSTSPPPNVKPKADYLLSLPSVPEVANYYAWRCRLVHIIAPKAARQTRRNRKQPPISVFGAAELANKAGRTGTVAPVCSQRVPGGVVHKLPADLRAALIGNPTALDAWKDITPLARNEFICWVEDAKKDMTRERRIRRTKEELEEGQRRPCCWPGCSHRERTGR